MNEIIRCFKNEVGHAEILNTENRYFVTLHSDFYEISSFREYKYKQDAIATFQFHHNWLVKQEKIYRK